MQHINISVTLFNTPLPLVHKMIQSVLNTTLKITLYLIDNSPNNQLNILTSQDNRIIYIHNPSNPGFGAGHNIAIQKSLDTGCKYHLVLNPDVYFESHVLESIINFMDSHPDTGLLMPKVLYPDGSIQYIAKLLPTPWDLFARRFIPIQRYLNRLNRKYSLTFFDYDSTVEIPFVSGCFMFIRTDVLQQTGLFDERYFMYLEDADLSRRIGQVSKTVLFPEVSIYHEYQRGAHKSLKLLWIFIRSAFTYFNQYGWFFDSYRKDINTKTLKSLGWEKE